MFEDYVSLYTYIVIKYEYCFLIFNFESSFGQDRNGQSQECYCWRAEYNNYTSKSKNEADGEGGKVGNRLLAPKAFFQNGESRDNVTCVQFLVKGLRFHMLCSMAKIKFFKHSKKRMNVCKTESLCCTPETNNIVSQLHSNKMKIFLNNKK